MGNGITLFRRCFSDAAGEVSRRRDPCSSFRATPDDGLGHSFCYIRSLESYPVSSSENTITSHSLLSSDDSIAGTTTTFSSISGASVSANASSPLSTSLNDPCYLLHSGQAYDKASSFQSSQLFASVPLQPVPRRSFQSGSGPFERKFLSGPIERVYGSGPIDLGVPGTRGDGGGKVKKRKILRLFRKALRRGILGEIKASGGDSIGYSLAYRNGFRSDDDGCGGFCGEDENENVQWAHGKAGEDRMHVVISEDDGWVFIGIYDGFNGPDAPDFLLSNLYFTVRKEIESLFCRENSGSNDSADVKIAEERSERERITSLDGRAGEKCGSKSSKAGAINHSDVLKVLESALKKTEEAFLEISDQMATENPELALMGSCVLVMLMRGEDIYLMNVGDSRAILAQSAATANGTAKSSQDTRHKGDENLICDLKSIQLTWDHSTYVDEEVERIKKEHTDDASAIVNERVKGYLKVTRAFGAGFLKQPKWNDALLEMFRIDYIGNSPYINCAPSLVHHRLSPRDRFLILSSDGLNQYFSNEEAVSKVASFLASFPEGDPAQHLVEEVLFRAAKQAGVDFHELLEIPQGERRRYHDDVSIIIISLEGRIWRSSM
ncbi:hypothetical protein MLD38_032638 [Melastoma candidum]|uniref:Uncharacterized protein n=1 Tax=Melastoma candidum TaxID=119954 RepID=A0ACB9M612_9MYRT|nr:hypothetical protein MLD38_032638 [Melastoma candidum]